MQIEETIEASSSKPNTLTSRPSLSGGVTPGLQCKVKKQQKVFLRSPGKQPKFKVRPPKRFGCRLPTTVGHRKKRVLIAASGPPTKIPKVAGECEDLVGSVHETDSQHRERHPKALPGCARCQWLQWGAGWQLKQGSFISRHGDRSERIQWVAEHSSQRGGAWALGCIVCAKAVQRVSAESSLLPRGLSVRLATEDTGDTDEDAAAIRPNSASIGGWPLQRMCPLSESVLFFLAPCTTSLFPTAINKASVATRLRRH